MTAAGTRRWVAPGVLYLVATPIGNRSDLSTRARQVLAEVDLVVAEDTRVTGRLLKYLDISVPLLSWHGHSGSDRLADIVRRLEGGSAIAVVSDAGLPAVSDPGRELVEAAWAHHLPVSPIPGPSAGVTAFAASGFELPWVQWGFLPARGAERRGQLAAVLAAPGAQVLYEAPHRVRGLVDELVAAGAGDRLLVWARELTKLHEQWFRGTVADAAASLAAGPLPRGEWTLVLGPQRPSKAAPLGWDAAVALVDRLVAAGAPGSEACRRVASDGALSRRELYRRWHARTGLD